MPRGITKPAPAMPEMTMVAAGALDYRAG